MSWEDVFQAKSHGGKSDSEGYNEVRGEGGGEPDQTQGQTVFQFFTTDFFVDFGPIHKE